jgi:type IV secretion system protein TrbI
MWRWLRSRPPAKDVPVRDAPPPVSASAPAPAPAAVRDHRVQPAGVLPQRLQAWLLTGIAFAMMVIIAWSTHSSPARVHLPALDRPVEPNQARIEEYQRRLDEETRRLQKEQGELNELRTAQARGTSKRGLRTAGDRENRSAAPEPNRERTLHADNVSFTRRRDDFQSPSRSPLRAAAERTEPAAPASTVSAASPPSSDVLPEGSLMEAVLLNRLDGTFAGPVMCLVSVPLYARGADRVLVPEGARVLGESKPVATFGQSRLAITLHRLILPDGRRVSLDAAQGLTAVGEAGLTDKVDHHYTRVFGASVALGLLSGFARYGTRTGFDESFGDDYRQAVGTNIAQSGIRVLDRFTNILPTVTIREGQRLRIYVTHDVPLTPPATR